MRVLGINVVLHDPSAALVVDGRVVAAAEEERFSRRKGFLSMFRDLVYATGDGGFAAERVDWSALAKPRSLDAEMGEEHADLAASVQTRLEEVMLELARWTYDAAGGFREDAELAYRVRRCGWQLRRGDRTVTHPVRLERRWVSLKAQRGNADDAYLCRRYGPQWRDKLEVPAGRRRRHAAVATTGIEAIAAGLLGARTIAGLLAAAWFAGTAEFAAARITPGPRTRDEVLTMLLTSVAIPPLATAFWIQGGAREWLR
jgi:hypothetical protein